MADSTGHQRKGPRTSTGTASGLEGGGGAAQQGGHYSHYHSFLPLVVQDPDLVHPTPARPVLLTCVLCPLTDAVTQNLSCHQLST